MFDSRALITGAAFLASGLNGITFAFVGASLPTKRTFMEIDFGQAGLFMAMMQAGLAVAALIGGLLSGIVRIEKIMMLVRLVCSRLSLHLCNSKIILFLILFQSFMLLLVWLGDSRTSMVSVALCSLACSGLYPCFLALTGTLYYRVSGTALGILTTTAGLGGIIICWLTGIVSEEVNVQLGFIVPVLCSMIAFVVYTTICRPLCNEDRGLQAVFTAS